MSDFASQPLTVTEQFSDWREWRLEQPLTFRAVTVPAGFITDGASVPRPLWWFIPSWGSYSRAAVVHDYLCLQLAQGTPHASAPTRKAADAIFYDAMVDCGVNTTVRFLMWAAVRIAAILTRK